MPFRILIDSEAGNSPDDFSEKDEVYITVAKAGPRSFYEPDCCGATNAFFVRDDRLAGRFADGSFKRYPKAEFEQVVVEHAPSIQELLLPGAAETAVKLQSDL